MHPWPPRIKRAIAAPRRMIRDSRGTSAVEYGLIAALIVLAMMASFRGVAEVTRHMWNTVSSKVVNAR